MHSTLKLNNKRRLALFERKGSREKLDACRITIVCLSQVGKKFKSDVKEEEKKRIGHKNFNIVHNVVSGVVQKHLTPERQC